MNPRLRRAASRSLVLAATVGFGCVSGAQMYLAPPDPPRSFARGDVPASCELVITDVADDRSVPGEFGRYLRTKIVSEDVDAWLVAQLSRLESRELALVGADQPPGRTPRVALDFGLAKSYLDIHPSTIAATVVGRVSLETVHPPEVAAGPSQADDRVYLRGRELNMNWAGTEAEVNALFDDAFENLNDQLRDEALDVCRGTEPQRDRDID